MQLAKIKSVTKIGKRHTLDLEVDHKDHNFYAEGLVTSNSHSYCYSICSFYTAYLKVHHPQEFYLALLQMAQNEPDPFVEISKISQELGLFGIKLLPPDLSKSQKDFSIEGKNLRYGLNSIKGISDKSIESLLTFRGKEFNNKYEVFFNAKDCGLNIGILCGLIQAGCLDSFNEERCSMILEAQVFNCLTEREKTALLECGESHQYNLFAGLRLAAAGQIINEKGKSVFTEKRIEKLRGEHTKFKQIYDQNIQHHKFCNWYFERKLLGYSYSYNLREVFEEPKSSFTPLLEVSSLSDQQEVRLVGVVGETKKGKGKDSGNDYFRMDLSDESARITSMFMNNKKFFKLTEYLENGNVLPKEGQIVIVVGKKNGDTFFVDRLAIMDERIALKLKDVAKE